MASLKNKLTTFAAAGLIALASGCGRNTTRTDNSRQITVILQEAGRPVITQIYTDDDGDGSVDAYLSGPTDNDDKLIPEIMSSNTVAKQSFGSVRRFYDAHPENQGAAVGRSYSTGNTWTFVLPHETMNSQEQEEMDKRYGAILQGTKNFDVEAKK